MVKILIMIIIFNIGFLTGAVWHSTCENNKNMDKHMGDEK